MSRKAWKERLLLPWLGEILIKVMINIRIENGSCVKALKYAKNTFFNQKVHFFTPISEHLAFTHLNHSEFDLFRWLISPKTRRNIPAHPKSTWCEFSATITPKTRKEFQWFLYSMAGYYRKFCYFFRCGQSTDKFVGKEFQICLFRWNQEWFQQNQSHND